LSGVLSASEGNIGGWTIGASTLYSATDVILDSGNKALYINDSTWQNDGIQLDYNSGDPRFYVGNGSSNALIFDGTALHISSSMMALDGAGGKIVLGGILTDTSNVVVLDGSAVKMYGDNSTTFAMMNANGLTLVDNSVTSSTFTSTAVTLYGSTLYNKAEVVSGGMNIYRDVASVATKIAIFGSTTVLGGNDAVTTTSTDNVIRLDSTGVKIFDNSAD